MSGQGNRESSGLRFLLSPQGYQFYGSEGTLQKTFEDPNVPGRWLPLGNWVWVQPIQKQGAIEFKAKPLLSSLRESSESPPKWTYHPNPHLSLNPEIARHLHLRPMHHPDGVGVKKWRNARKQGRFLTSTWAEPTPDQGFFLRSGSMPFWWFSGFSDRGYDVAPSVFKSRTGTAQVPESDWYRGAGLHTVTSEEFGARTFIVMVTISHEFYCYPVGVQGETFGVTPNKANVEGRYVQSHPAPLPSWVTPFDVGESSALSAADHIKQPQPLWVFSPQGDKAAAIMVHLDDPWADAYHTSSRYQSGVKEFDLQETRPGVVEVAFTIAITGENPEDFTFTVALQQALYSGDDGRGYLAVGYAATDFPDLPGNVHCNDLLILEQQYFIGSLFSPAQNYVIPPTTLVDATRQVIVNPPLVAVAQVTAPGDGVVMRWLSAHTAFWNANHIYGGITAASLMNPTFDALADKPAESATTQQWSFHTAINAMDLSTLTFCFGVSATLTGLCTAGSAFVNSELIQWSGPFCASAAYVVTYALGVKDEERSVGHPQLKAVLPAYFALTHSHPALAALTPVNLKATITSVATMPADDLNGLYGDLYKTVRYRTPVAWESGNEADYYRSTEFADVTVNTGVSGATPQTVHVLHASAMAFSFATDFPAQLGPNALIAGTELNAEGWMVTVPRIFQCFDGQLYRRPGLRWMKRIQDSNQFWRPNGWPDSLVMETGDSSYSGYPMGLILHARFAEMALFGLNNPCAQLSAEPNGSYALFFGPFAAATTTVPTHPNINAPVPVLTSFVIEQNLMDVIKVRLPKNNAYLEGKTTHLEQMNQAFGLTLSPNDYLYAFGLSGSALLLHPHKTLAPTLIPDWRTQSPYDHHYQFYDGQRYGGSIILSPLAMGWKKTVYANTVDGWIAQTTSCFDTRDLQDCPTPWPIAWPTPRMEGLFTNLPLVKES